MRTSVEGHKGPAEGAGGSKGLKSNAANAIHRFSREVRAGADLPSNGVTYYEVPKEYGVTKYRYTVV
jgi:hypothetical protein